MLLEMQGIFLIFDFSEYEKIVADARIYDDNIIEIVNIKLVFDISVFIIYNILNNLL